MREQRKDTKGGIRRRVVPLLEPQAPEPKRDLVVDLSGFVELDSTSLALLLTAQQQVEEENREVWLAGVPFELWKALNAMGLGSFFRPFPDSGRVAV